MICEAALHTSGAAGPSGDDVYGWRCLCSAFGSVSGELCCSVAVLACRLCSCFVDPLIISLLVDCRLIALDKNPGVLHIGVGEVVQRIIAKSAYCLSDLTFSVLQIKFIFVLGNGSHSFNEDNAFKWSI